MNEIILFGKYLGVVLLMLYGLWIFYLAIMNLVRSHQAGTLSKTTFILAIPILFIGYVIDFTCNILVSILFLDLPKEFTVSERLYRYKYFDKGWKNTVSTWVADNLLDIFDPSGKHI